METANPAFISGLWPDRVEGMRYIFAIGLCLVWQRATYWDHAISQRLGIGYSLLAADYFQLMLIRKNWLVVSPGIFSV